MDSRGDMVLATPASGGTLPRIYVNICSVGRPTRAVAAVDTCSSRNLISQQLVASLGAPVSPTTATILAIDGTPSDVRSMVELTVERPDGAVNLPKTSSKFIVVADLSTVRTDVVLGEELIAAVGGINLWYEKGCLSSVILGQSPDLPIPVSNPSSMGGQDHIPELKHTLVASETKPEVTNNRQPNGKSASVLPKPQQPAERVASSDDTKQDDVASALIASSTTNRNIATALKTINVSAIPVIASSTGNPNAPTPKVVDVVGLPDSSQAAHHCTVDVTGLRTRRSPRSQTGDVDRAMLGHPHPKQLDSSGDLPYQSRIAARHPLSISSIISLFHFPHFVFFFILLLLSGGGV